ncbi:MAG: orotidine-5'-phosphate decarboxylase [Thaumarchaeota archaeon]|nr:orotidine-5'-phosphate decarboxylase [Nitrososphaerota archaeon]
MGFREDLLSSSKKHSSRVILALDVTGPSQTREARAAKLVQDLGDEVAGVKVNWHLMLPYGLEGMAEVIRLSATKNLPIIADIKLNDVESTNLEAVDLLFTSGISAVIANPFVGAEEGLSQVIARGKKLGRGVILLVYMSHAGAKEGYGLIVDGKPLYVEFARRVRDWDADGAIVSAKSPSIVREVRTILRKEQLILSPGVGVQGGRADRSVIDAGTDFAIIGRSIIDAADPRSALKAFNSSMPAP